MEFSKGDWKLFRQKINHWQETYMEQLLLEYKDLMNGDSPASNKFWALENRIKEDKKKPGVILELRKGEMATNILRLINDGAITLDDLEGFSGEFKDYIKLLLENIW